MSDDFTLPRKHLALIGWFFDPFVFLQSNVQSNQRKMWTKTTLPQLVRFSKTYVVLTWSQLMQSCSNYSSLYWVRSVANYMVITIIFICFFQSFLSSCQRSFILSTSLDQSELIVRAMSEKGLRNLFISIVDCWLWEMSSVLYLTARKRWIISSGTQSLETS